MKQPKTYVVCGAKNRQGEPCQKPPLEGKTRCKLHGGATPKGLKNAVKHGLYVKTLSEDERAMAESIRANNIGRLDDELVFTRILLNRIIDLHKDIHDAPDDPKNKSGFVLSEITRSSKGGGSKSDTTAGSKRPDTYAMIDRYLGRIAMLEKNRADLISAAAATAEDPNAKASEVVSMLRAMIRTETDADDARE